MTESQRHVRAPPEVGGSDQDREAIRTVSHDLRAPLGAAAGFLETVLLRWDELSDGTKRELIQRAVRTLGRQVEMAERLLDGTGPAQAEGRADPRPMDLRRGVVDVVEDWRTMHPDHDFVLEVEDDLEVLADPVALGRVLENLLSNAVGHSPDASPIRIRGWRSNPGAVVEVVNDGVGISREELHVELEDDSGSSDHRRGIGLAIVQRYVDALGGSLDVRDEPGHGTAFVFTLPIPEPAP